MCKPTRQLDRINITHLCVQHVSTGNCFFSLLGPPYHFPCGTKRSFFLCLIPVPLPSSFVMVPTPTLMGQHVYGLPYKGAEVNCLSASQQHLCAHDTDLYFQSNMLQSSSSSLTKLAFPNSKLLQLCSTKLNMAKRQIQGISA